jgi:hypothetical protein
VRERVAQQLLDALHTIAVVVVVVIIIMLLLPLLLLVVVVLAVVVMLPKGVEFAGDDEHVVDPDCQDQKGHHLCVGMGLWCVWGL